MKKKKDSISLALQTNYLHNVFQALHEEAQQIMNEAKARQPIMSYVTMLEAEDYFDTLTDDVTGIRIKVPKSSIQMRKRSDGVWVQKKNRQ